MVNFLQCTKDPKIRNDLIGAWREWKVFQKVCEYREIFGEIIGCQVGYPEGKPETIIDFVRSDALAYEKILDAYKRFGRLFWFTFYYPIFLAASSSSLAF